MPCIGRFKSINNFYMFKLQFRHCKIPELFAKSTTKIGCTLLHKKLDVQTKTLVVLVVVEQGFSPQQVNLQVEYNIFIIYCKHFSEGWLFSVQIPTEHLQNKGRKNVICSKWSSLELCTRLYMKVNDNIFIIGNIQCFFYTNDMTLVS